MKKTGQEWGDDEKVLAVGAILVEARLTRGQVRQTLEEARRAREEAERLREENALLLHKARQMLQE